MIKTIVNTGYPILYQIDNTHSLPSYTGAVQWNGVTKKFEVSNGSGWSPIDNYITFNIDNNLSQIIIWAEQKMREENELEEKAKNNMTLSDLLKQRKKIEEQILTVDLLSK